MPQQRLGVVELIAARQNPSKGVSGFGVPLKRSLSQAVLRLLNALLDAGAGFRLGRAQQDGGQLKLAVDTARRRGPSEELLCTGEIIVAEAALAEEDIRRAVTCIRCLLDATLDLSAVGA